MKEGGGGMGSGGEWSRSGRGKKEGGEEVKESMGET